MHLRPLSLLIGPPGPLGASAGRASSRSVGVAAVLYAGNDDPALVFVDFVDDPIVAPPSGAQPLELAEQRLARALRVRGDGGVDRLYCSSADLLGKPVEVTEAFRRDPDLVHQAL